jgi:hypothetical protein
MQFELFFLNIFKIFFKFETFKNLSNLFQNKKIKNLNEKKLNKK